MTAADRLGRLLAVVPWIVAREGVTVGEVCERFGLGREELLDDLTELSMCGLPPYTPDQLVEVMVGDDDEVTVRFADYLARPVRLTPAEALTVLAAGRALVGDEGRGGPLDRALDKLREAVGLEEADVVDVEVEVPPDALGDLRRSVDERRRVEVTYYTLSRDELTRRRFDPHRVFNREGNWYVTGHDHLRGDLRTLRVARIHELEVLDERFEAPAEPPPALAFLPDAADPRVVLDVGPEAAWVAEQYPVEAVEERPGGRLRVRLVSGGRAWLERLLLRLGPDAAVVEGPAQVACEAAERILARYRDGAGR